MRCFDITDEYNVKLLSEMIAAESAGCTEVDVDLDDIEKAVMVASYIRQIVRDSQQGCIIREVHNCD